MRILFHGDSITDADRDRLIKRPNQALALGHGYAALASAALLALNDNGGYEIYNRGVSGDKVFQLVDRWENDCIKLQPDILSLLIGVNDFGHTLNHDYDGTLEVFDHDLRKLLIETTTQLSNMRLILGEPFVVKGGSRITNDWFPDFAEYQKAVRSIASELKVPFIAYQEIFDQALEKAPASHWCPDGIHPSLAGSYLMKEAWLTTFRSLTNS